MAPTLDHVLAAFLDLLLPRTCPGCRCPLPYARCAVVCATCLAAVGAAPVRAVPVPAPPGLPRVWAVAAYDAPVRDLVLAHKERGRVGLSWVLAVALARAAAPARPDVLVWVPSSRAAVRARGYDHARRLAVRAARLLGVPAVPALAVARRVADSAGLSAADRAANLAGAFRADPRRVASLHGRRVVVVDDVMTTGTTLAEAARALRAAGVTVSGGAVVAAGARRARPPRPPHICATAPPPVPPPTAPVARASVAAPPAAVPWAAQQPASPLAAARAAAASPRAPAVPEAPLAAPGRGAAPDPRARPPPPSRGTTDTLLPGTGHPAAHALRGPHPPRLPRRTGPNACTRGRRRVSVVLRTTSGFVVAGRTSMGGPYDQSRSGLARSARTAGPTGSPGEGA